MDDAERKLQQLWDHIERRETSILSYVHNILNEQDKRYQAQFMTLKDAAELAKDAVELAMAASEKAVVKAEVATDKRFESVNEFRGSMADQHLAYTKQFSDLAATFARNDLMQSKFQSMDKKMDDFMAFRLSTMGKTSAYSDVWGWILGIAAISIAVSHYIFSH